MAMVENGAIDLDKDYEVYFHASEDTHIQTSKRGIRVRTSEQSNSQQARFALPILWAIGGEQSVLEIMSDPHIQVVVARRLAENHERYYRNGGFGIGRALLNIMLPNLIQEAARQGGVSSKSCGQYGFVMQGTHSNSALELPKSFIGVATTHISQPNTLIAARDWIGTSIHALPFKERRLAIDDLPNGITHREFSYDKVTGIYSFAKQLRLPGNGTAHTARLAFTYTDPINSQIEALDFSNGKVKKIQQLIEKNKIDETITSEDWQDRESEIFLGPNQIVDLVNSALSPTVGWIMLSTRRNLKMLPKLKKLAG
jgi:hypothetical protein